MPENLDNEMIQQTIGMLIGITQATNDSDANKLFASVVEYIYHDSNNEIAANLKENSGTLLTLLRNIKPQDAHEEVLAASFAIGYLLGTLKLTQKSKEDRIIALRLLESSSVAMTRLCKKQLIALQKKGNSHVYINRLQI